MIRVAICEDEEVHTKIIYNYLKDILMDLTNQYEILEFNSGEQLLSNYPEQIDIILLDILMGEISGMDAARNIRKFDDNVEIIFTTSLIDHIQEGYEVRAYRYLLKPIEYDELEKHIGSCINHLINGSENHIIIQGKSKVYKVKIEDITFIEIIKKDMFIHTAENTYNTKMSLSKMEKELTRYSFFRCHKSYLINMKHIETLKANIAIINKQVVPISRHRLKELKDKLAYVLGDVLC